MNVEQIADQQTVTEDISRVVRLTDLAKADILNDEERDFLAILEQHRVGSTVGCEVVAGSGVQSEAQSQRLTLSQSQRERADAILSAHGAQLTN